MEPLKLIEIFDENNEDGLTRTQQENLFLYEMYQSAIAEISGRIYDCPTDRQILDHLFKGRRQFKDIRAMEERMIEVIEDERAHMLRNILEAMKESK